MDKIIRESDLTFKVHSPGKLIYRMLEYEGAVFMVLIMLAAQFMIRLVANAVTPAELWVFRFLSAIFAGNVNLFMLLVFTIFVFLPNNTGILGVEREGMLAFRMFGAEGLTFSIALKEMVAYDIATRFRGLAGCVILRHNNDAFVAIPIQFFGKKNLAAIDSRLSAAGLPRIKPADYGLKTAWSIFKEDRAKLSFSVFARRGSSKFYAAQRANKTNYLQHPGVTAADFQDNRKISPITAFGVSFLSLIISLLLVAVIVSL
jgi:hypothetical protein